MSRTNLLQIELDRQAIDRSQVAAIEWVCVDSSSHNKSINYLHSKSLTFTTSLAKITSNRWQFFCLQEKKKKKATIIIINNDDPPLNTLHHSTVTHVSTFQIKPLYGKWYASALSFTKTFQKLQPGSWTSENRTDGQA